MHPTQPQKPTEPNAGILTKSEIISMVQTHNLITPPPSASSE